MVLPIYLCGFTSSASPSFLAAAFVPHRASDLASERHKDLLPSFCWRTLTLDRPLMFLAGDIGGTKTRLALFPEKRYVVLAPGTGLGQAFLVIREGEPFIFPSEGGHVDFAPTSDIQVELLRYLMGQLPRVSYERVLSGPGLENIYNFLRDTVYHEEPKELAQRCERADRAPVISQAGLEGAYPIATQAVDIFATILGSYAGNLALTFRANRGVFLGGGIPPKMLSKLEEGSTVRAFLKKERMAELVAAIPLRVIMDDHAALLGAGSIAERLLTTKQQTV